MVLSDGRNVCVLPATQDHKRALDGDQGPNTGGMGAYCDDAILTDGMQDTILERIVEPALAGMRRRGTPFRGFLYCGLMITAEGPQVLEFNVRLGDPETQPLLYRLEGDFTGLLASAARGALDPSLVRTGEHPTACVVLASGGYPGSYERGLPIEGPARGGADRREGLSRRHEVLRGDPRDGGRPRTRGDGAWAYPARGPCRLLPSC